jgi:hypothetical protein
MKKYECITTQSMEESYNKPIRKCVKVGGREYIIEYSLVKIDKMDRLCVSILDTAIESVYKETFECYDLNPGKSGTSLLWMKVLIDTHMHTGRLKIQMIESKNLELKGKFYRKPVEECKSIDDCAALVWVLEYKKSNFSLQIPKLL